MFCLLCVCTPVACLVLWRPEDEVGSPGNRVTDGNCRLPCGYEELNTSSQEEQPLLLIAE